MSLWNDVDMTLLAISDPTVEVTAAPAGPRREREDWRATWTTLPPIEPLRQPGRCGELKQELLDLEDQLRKSGDPRPDLLAKLKDSKKAAIDQISDHVSRNGVLVPYEDSNDR